MCVLTKQGVDVNSIGFSTVMSDVTSIGFSTVRSKCIDQCLNNIFSKSQFTQRNGIPIHQSKLLISIRGRLHGAFSTPGLNSALLTGLKFFAITWTISTPGLKRYTIRSRHQFAEVKKAFILFSCNK